MHLRKVVCKFTELIVGAARKVVARSNDSHLAGWSPSPNITKPSGGIVRGDILIQCPVNVSRHVPAPSKRHSS